MCLCVWHILNRETTISTGTRLLLNRISKSDTPLQTPLLYALDCVYDLDLNLERSRQTPDVGYHVDEWRRLTNEGDSWNSRWKSSRQILCQGRSTGGLFGGKKNFCIQCKCWCQDAFELVLIVTHSAWICWDKKCARHCHKTMDNLKHSGSEHDTHCLVLDMQLNK